MKFGQTIKNEQKLCLVGGQIELVDFFLGAHTLTLTRARTHAHTHTHTRTHTHTHTRTHARMHARTHARALTGTHFGCVNRAPFARTRATTRAIVERMQARDNVHLA
jgi:hypothetical protein